MVQFMSKMIIMQGLKFTATAVAEETDGARWRGRVGTPNRGPGFNLYRWHCVVSLSNTL